MAAKKKQTVNKKQKNSVNVKKPEKEHPEKEASPAISPKSDIKEALPVVGIGASAGGLEALEGLLRNIKPGCNMAFVIIQHRATEPKSVMLSLLRKYTELEVYEIEDGKKIEPDCIYINPPHKDITVEDGKLYCEESTTSLGVRLPIDFFFRSLAKDQGERSICIILSGTGTDGTLGMKEVKAAGGMAMAQDEKQAKYPSMPASAIDTGLIDFILPVEKMPDELMRYVKHPYLEKSRAPVGSEDKFEKNLLKIFKLIRTNTGHDFSNYKRNTIRRRIERRMAVHKISEIDDYIKLLSKDTQEVKTLFKDMIITVTNFFRDSEAFEALKEKVIRQIVRTKPANANIRIWIPGCATGEEAYSIAILLEEVISEQENKHDVQIFATDIDDDAIDTARYGRYPDSIAADVSKVRLNRFFNRFDSSYKIKESVREKLVFAKQNLIKDPPFSKLDLICCRNVLIYMNSELQKKIISLFHYTLNPSGFLFLGTSETIGQFTDLFSPVDNKQRIFKQKPGILRANEQAPLLMPTAYEEKYPVRTGQHRRETNIGRLAERLILTEYSQPCVLLNEKYDIVYFNGNTDPFLTMPSGEPTTHILKMVRKEIHYSLSIVLHKADREQKTITSEELHIKSNGDTVNFNLIARPVTESDIKEKLYMVIFDIKSRSEKEKKKPDKEPDKQDEPHVKFLEQELSSTKEYLQTTIEELETSNEELKSSNEELQSTNEELQSTNEELETSREELQSTNEELRTVNSEHQNKIDELARANDDLNNLLASTNIATIFLDSDLKIKRFTPESKNLFKFIETDTGRPLDHIVNKLNYENLREDTQKVLDNLERIEREILSKDGTWLRVRIAPYRTTNNIIDGVVITVFDISREKDAQEYAENIVETIREPLIVLDKDLKVISANNAFYRNFKVKSEETIGKFIYNLGNRQWDIPQLKKLLEDILSTNTSFEDFEVEHDFPNIGAKKMILNARRIHQKGKTPELILLAIEDVT